MRKLLSVLFISATLFATAQGPQDNVVLRGFVLDKDNNKPLELAAVQVKGSQLGALTEDNGFFTLPLPKTNLKDSIRFSFIGYLPKSISVQNYKQGDTIHILLETSIATKQEVVITAENAKGVLLKAITNLKKNLYRDTIIQTGFYRQYHKENGKYVRLIEADVSVAFNLKDPYLYSFHELLQTNKQRRSENYETNGDIHGDHFVDLLKEDPFSYNKTTFLNPKNLDFFSPKFESEDTAQWIIKTQYKEASSAKLERARIWVQKETYAITRIEVEKFPNPYYIRSRYAPDSRWQLVNETDVIKLDKYKGKFVVSSLERTYNHHVLNRRTQQVDYIVEESFDLYFYNYQGENVGETVNKGKYVAFTSFYTSEYNYDEKYWNNYKPFADHPLKDQIKKDLEHAKPLETQFREAGK
ncbi:MAG: carboxypeptidase-like regulatory protein [Bacteroidota bacterium]|nr:carboxypeptidase-like regulatory protein [Bacteroidota bacterium]